MFNSGEVSPVSRVHVGRNIGSVAGALMIFFLLAMSTLHRVRAVVIDSCFLSGAFHFRRAEQLRFFLMRNSRQFTTLNFSEKIVWWCRLKDNNFGGTSIISSLSTNKNSITFGLTVHFDFSCKLFVALARSFSRNF